ncbi:protein Spindly-like [Halichondria panicea]|uniref:protein Spindly-like n=1 Tax=Halichondria panicea TaxID=6063 RepID=UPI00312BC23C
MNISELTLELEVKQLRAHLEEKEETLDKAAQFGRQLLETNKELEQQLEESTKTCYERIEGLEQEKHSLTLKTNCQAANLVSVQQELEGLQSQLEDRHRDEVRRLEEVCQRRAHADAQTNASLKAEVEKLEAQLHTLTEKCHHEEATIRQLREDLSTPGNSTLLQTELEDVEQLLLEERSKAEDLEVRLLEAEGCSEVLAVEREGLLSKVATLEEECQERCRLSNEWFEGLKEAKDHNVALKSELDLLKLDQEAGYHGNKGNSLFGEVEDKRVEAERKFISLQVRHESLEKNHSITKQRYARLKAEMSALFCRYSSTSADSNHLQRLQRALSQSQSENEGLRNKMRKLETQLSDSTSLQDQRKLVSAFVDFGDKAEYIQFLEHEIDQAKSQQSAVLKELDVKRTQLVWESNKLTEAESKLYHSEQQNARRKEELTKIRIRLQESTEKMNQTGTKIAQLEADKTFLEGELKSRRGRKTFAPNPPMNYLNTGDRSLNNQSSSSSSLRNCDPLSKPSDIISKDKSVSLANHQETIERRSESNGELKRYNSSEKLEQPQRVINLLEELETEFSRQKSSDVVSASKGDTENSVPSSKVVYVSNKKADQCAQQ